MVKGSYENLCTESSDGQQSQTTGRNYLERLSHEIPFLHPLMQPIALEQIHALQKTFFLSDYLNEQMLQDPVYENETLLYRYFPHEMPGNPRYGILAKARQDDLWATRAVITPFSNDKAAVCELAKKCTVLQLSPIHLLDVIGDFVSRAEPE